MNTDVAGLLASLQDALKRLGERAGGDLPQGPVAQGYVEQAATHLARAQSALEAACAAIESDPPAPAAVDGGIAPAPSALMDRIVLIGPSATSETFRTKVKIKTHETPAPPEVPAVGASDALPAVEPPAPSPDDLTRIRGIDRPLAARLAAAGVTSFTTIAGWTRDDVRRIGEGLALGRQISRQGWIEQAALLAAGTARPSAPPSAMPPAAPSIPAAPIAAGAVMAPNEAVPVEAEPAAATARSGEFEVSPPLPEIAPPVTAAPTDAPILTSPPEELSDPITSAVSEPAATTLVSLEAAPAVEVVSVVAAVTAVAPGDETRTADEPANEPPVPVAEVNTAMLDRVVVDDEKPTPQRTPESVAMSGAPEVEPELPPVALTAEPAAAPLPADPLYLISGVDPTMAEILNANGVTRWADIANWRRADIERIAPLVGPHARIAGDGWIEQAAMLAGGRPSHYATRFGLGDFDAVVPPPAAEPLPEPRFTAWSTADAAPPTAVSTVAEVAKVAPAPEESVPAAPVAIPKPAATAAPAAVIAPQAATAAQIDTTTRETASAPPVTPVAPAAPPPREPPAKPIDLGAVLEQVLAAQVANDTAERTMPAPRSSTPPAATMSALATIKAHAAPPLHIEDEEFPELSVGEAEVAIIVRPPPNPLEPAAASTEPRRAPPSARSLLSRLRRTAALDEIDAQSYAAYRDRVEEASVEIFKPGAKGR